MRPDERAILDACKARIRPNGKEFPRDVIASTGINHKRAWYLLGKWASKGWYNYGCNIDLGWMEKEGLEA
jgi:hypothetical protein